MAELSAEEKARVIVDAAQDLKAEELTVLDMRGVSSFADTFVILSGRSDRHVRAVADAIVRALRDAGEAPLGVEGLDEGRWVLIDANDAIIHVFEPEAREQYDLERLWSDAPTLEIEAAGAPAS